MYENAFSYKLNGCLFILFNTNASLKFSFSFHISALLTSTSDRQGAYAGCSKGTVTRKSNTREIKQNSSADIKVALCFEILHKKANKNLSYQAVGLQHPNNC